jgi:enoyl-CoA hydratase/carnithine racemase
MSVSSDGSGDAAQSDDVVLYEASDGVAVVTLNRPDRLNAWTPALGDRYFERLLEAARDPEVRAIVVTGAGRGFCAGADMALLDDVSDAAADGAPQGKYRAVDTLTIPKPVIAAVNGAAVGIGLTYALTCDIRFAGEGVKLAASFARLGLIAEDGMSWLLQRLASQPAALELLLSGRTFLAEEAYRLGLVSRLAPKENVLEQAVEYARDLAESCSPLSMALIKQQVYLDADRPFATALHESQLLTNRSLAFPDFKEGLASYAEKRKPRVAGLASDSLTDLPA